MTRRKLIRSSHAGKSPDDVEAYKKFLRGKKGLEKTVEDPQKLYKTDSSSFEEEGAKTGEIQKRSKWLKASDWASDHLLALVIGSIMIPIIFGTIAWAWQISLDIKLQTQQLENIEGDIDIINSGINTIQEKNSTFEIFKVEIKKDIEFIKNKIGL